MTAVLYQEWITFWDETLRRKGQFIILFQDNFSGHIPPDNLTNIRIENFAANLTSHVQPLDAGIIRNFKAHYRKTFIARAIDRYDNGITPAFIYEIDQLEAMRMADVAWREVDTSTIRNCWRHAGILPEATPGSAEPLAPLIPVASLLNAEQDITGSLGLLEKRGVLSCQNCLSIEELLNPEQENEIIDVDITDEEISAAVHAKHKALQNLEVNGGDDDDDDVEVIEKPNRREALAASLTLQRYTADIGEPFARQLEVILSSFGRQTRLEETQSLRPSRITDYFGFNHSVTA